MFNVDLQNHVPDPQGTTEIQTWVAGKVKSTTRPLDPPGPLDFPWVFGGKRQRARLSIRNGSWTESPGFRTDICRLVGLTLEDGRVGR